MMWAASAQFSGGMKLGLGLSNLSGDISDNDMLFSPNLGFYGQYKLSDALTVQPELLLFGGGTLLSDGTNFKLQYIGIPVILKYNLGAMFNIQAGPQMSFLFATNPKAAKDGLKGTDLGLNLGLGVAFDDTSIDARYCLGLSNIADSADGELKTSLIQLSLGYKLFPRKGK